MYPVVCKLKSRSLVTVKGADVIQFLQGLLTNDITLLQQDRKSLYTMLLNVQVFTERQIKRSNIISKCQLSNIGSENQFCLYSFENLSRQTIPMSTHMGFGRDPMEIECHHSLLSGSLRINCMCQNKKKKEKKNCITQKEKMLVTSIFSASHNVIYPVLDKNHHFSYSTLRFLSAAACN